MLSKNSLQCSERERTSAEERERKSDRMKEEDSVARMKKSKLIEELEEAGIIDKNFSIRAKHSKLKGLLNSISIGS